MTRQCPSCGGFCGKAGCEREDVKGSEMSKGQQAAIEYTQRGGDQNATKTLETRTDTGLGGGDQNDNRAAFEAWMSKEHPDHSLEYVNERYTYSPPQRLWEAYQAALASPEVRALRKDAEQLDFLIAEECQVQALSLANGTKYRLYWPESDETQCEWYANPRAAIDSAIDAAMEKQK